MKVLFYNHTGIVSGAERVLLMILARLDRERFEPVVICPEGGCLMGTVNGLGVRTRGLKALDARFTWRLERIVKYLVSFAQVIYSARKLVRDEAPDIIHANSIRAGLVMSAATFGINVPVVWHVHDLLPHHPFSTAIRIFSVLSPRNRIIAISRAAAARFLGKMRLIFRTRPRMKIIYNAVDSERFCPSLQGRRSIRQALGITQSEIVFGSIGQLTPRKGQLELIRAFAEVSGKVSNTLLLIVGAPLFNRDLEYAESLTHAACFSGLGNRIRFLGSREDVPAIIQGLDVLVINSRAEAFGLTAVEAMASGIPVLATAIDGILEVVRQGETGQLVLSGNHRSLVQEMLMLLSAAELRETLGQNGRRDAVARFSIDRFLSEIESVYITAVARSKVPDFRQLQSLKTKTACGLKN